jgi:hypothetical protein
MSDAHPHPSPPLGMLRACPTCRRPFALRRTRRWLRPGGDWLLAFTCRFCGHRVTQPEAGPPGQASP